MKRPRLPFASIKHRLLILLLAPLTFVFTISLAIDYRAAVTTAGTAFDHGLSDDALALAARVKIGPGGRAEIDLPKAAEAVLRTDSEDEEFFSAWSPTGDWLAGDADLKPRLDAPVGEVLLGDGALRGKPVRRADYVSSLNGETVHVAFAETLNKRERTASQIFLAMSAPNLMLVLTSLAVVFFGVQAGLAPLTRLSHVIMRRAPDDLTELPTRGVPGEALPLLRAMNDLMAKLRAGAEVQRRFIADAAHQLKTPLAGLQTQLELAADDPPDASGARLPGILTAVRRLSQVTHQLLSLARMSPDSLTAAPMQKVDLALVIDDVASNWFDMAEKAGVDLSFEISVAPVWGSVWLLGEMIGNLIDNAVRYCGPGGAVVVRCYLDRGGDSGERRAVVEVEDNGPGIPPEERQLVFERFHRGSGAVGLGSGLGLAIVTDACRRHGAKLDLRDGADGRGCLFSVRFPAPVARA
ncbi:sensor histidine kinase [Alsobacter sp. SYSU M60028]|uniref:histidine kinase n=1 Tax=Alsobacter ponti TaxID=2962936 RepID=A0ABT1LEY7_9HYPH|nr:sensor histidine kinase [Alsobacter ponti]MCP8939688.1 sensor histidine kinase [Alsobacter ponti]